ncbi:hypothetical protein shn_31015 (plasmid) [Shinella sp. HZN7]|nr:hypothetical protein shn_31015 [Shinella sp. HZN7]
MKCRMLPVNGNFGKVVQENGCDHAPPQRLVGCVPRRLCILSCFKSGSAILCTQEFHDGSQHNALPMVYQY